MSETGNPSLTQTLLYLDGVSVSFDGYKALRSLSKIRYLCAGIPRWVYIVGLLEAKKGIGISKQWALIGRLQYRRTINL